MQNKEQEYTRTQESCYQVEAALTTARARVAELDLETERTRGRLDSQARQIGALEERMLTSKHSSFFAGAFRVARCCPNSLNMWP